ncbi:hypothetical protein U1Q18_012970, partial [Sarracenia purpurea var. burkii]
HGLVILTHPLEPWQQLRPLMVRSSGRCPQTPGMLGLEVFKGVFQPGCLGVGGLACFLCSSGQQEFSLLLLLGGLMGLLGFGLLLVACSVALAHGSLWVEFAASFAWTSDRSAAMLKGETVY